MRDLFFYLIDAIIPPRPTELLVRALSAEQLRGLDQGEGLPYHDPRVTALIWELKYHASGRSADLAGELVGEQLLAIASEELGKPLLVPVPMHAKRRRERGHNQTELLCKAALPFADGALTYAPRSLKRVVDTPTQQGKTRAERLKNVHGCMQGDAKAVSGRTCVVLDDVSTTGATLAEAKRALLAAGARSVHTLAFARS